MSRLLVVFATVALTSAASAQTGDAAFDAADQRLKEQSYARACELFADYLKAHGAEPLAREATAKRAVACSRAGKGDWKALMQLADNGEKDFARAWAAFFLFEQGRRAFDQVQPLLKQVAADPGRAGAEARKLLVRGAFLEMDRSSYDFARVNLMAELVLANSQDATEAAHARYNRGVARLRGGTQAAQGLKELEEVGAGTTEWADDAEYRRAESLEGSQAYERALAIYEAMVKRFSPQSSNLRASAEAKAQEIRRPWITLGVNQVALPGLDPHVSVSWRNVKDARWTLKRADPLQAGASQDFPDDANALARVATQQVSTWTSSLDVAEKHGQGNSAFPLKVQEPGVYVLEVQADGQTAREYVLVSQLTVLTKTDSEKVLVYVADVETGRAQPGAEVVLWARHDGAGADDERFTGKTDATGLATFPVQRAARAMLVWAKKGPQYALAAAGNGWSPSWSREQLAYVSTDRPLYKPGEQVGFKVYLRTREGGPSQPLAHRQVKLRVTDPTGRTVAEPQLTSNELGTAVFTLALPKAAPLGQWSVYADGLSEGLRQDRCAFQVEEYKPPESTVSVEPLGSPKPGEKVKFKVTAKYFSGGAVANAQGRAIVTLQGWSHTFGRWPDDPLDDDSTSGGYAYGGVHPSKRRPWQGWGQYGQQTLVFQTGADGTAEVEAAPPQVAPGIDLQYLVQVFVIDASRREITGAGSLKVSSREYFVDLRTDHFLYRPGERVTVKLRAEDPNGRPVDKDLLVRLMRVGQDGTASRIAEARTRLKGGQGAVLLDADAIGMVRAEVLDGAAAAPTVLAQTDLWLTDDQKPLVPPTNGFMIYTDRAQLRVGDKVRALVVGPRAGAHVLLTLESERVHLAQVVELVGRARFVELPLSAPLAPNCLLAAATFHDSYLQSQQRDLRVAGSAVELAVGVDFGVPSVEPGQTVAPAITMAGGPAGQAAEVALTVVDEALFSIAPERTDFLSFFGQQPRQHAVRLNVSQHLRSYMQRPRVEPVAQPPAAEVERKAEEKRPSADQPAEASPSLAAGMVGRAEAPAPPSAAPAMRVASKAKKDSARDEADDTQGPGAGAAPVKVRTDFGSSAGWFPELKGKLGARLTQKVALPDSLTSWQATATVVTAGPHLGQGRGHLRTEKPLMVRLQAPRFFVEGDEVVLSAVVESHLPQASHVSVSITAPGFRPLSPTSGALEVEPGRAARFDARFKVVELGERTVSALARAGAAADAMEWKLPAMVHGSAQRQFFAGRLADRFSVEFELPDQRKPALTRLELSLSPSLLAVMFDGLPYLAQYPYGCVEQTLSRFVPAVIARRAATQLKLPAARVPADLDAMVQSGLHRLSGFQHGDGGWGWWQADRTNLWMTAYVVYALGLTRDAGVEVQAGVIDRGRSYLVDHLGEAQNTPETHAFMVFALSQTGEVPKQALNKAYAWRTSLTPRARAQLALALLRLGDKRARVAVENLDDIVKAASSRKDAAVGEVGDAWSTSAAIEATAFTLMAYARYDLKSPLLAKLTDFLVLRRNGGKWRSTRDTAFAIYALSELAMREEASQQRGTFVVSLNGQELQRLKYSAGGLDLSPVLLADSAFKAGKNVLEVKRDGAGTGYFAATWDVFNQNDFLKGVGGDVKVKRSYTLLGKPAAEKGAAPTEYGMPVESGVRVRVDLELTANKAVEFVMVEDLKPAGFEAVQLTSGPQVCNYACAHAELRTDRVAMFLSQLPVGTTKVSYELRAEVPGKFAALPARLEAMYAPEIQATADEMRFEVRDEPTGGRAAKE